MDAGCAGSGCPGGGDLAFLWLCSSYHRGRGPKPGEEPEQLNIARLLNIGITKLGYSENEVLQMTPRKFFLLYDEYLRINGLNKKILSIDELP